MSETRAISASSIVRVAGNIASGMMGDSTQFVTEERLQYVDEISRRLASMIATGVEGRPLLTVERLEKFLATRNLKREFGAIMHVNTDIAKNDEFYHGYMFAMAEVFDLLEGRI